MLQSIGLTLLVLVATLLCVLLFMLFGWYVVWQLFLSKFKFLRELVGDTSSLQGDSDPSENVSIGESSPTPPGHRPKSARLRRPPVEGST
ncbi:small integral membrane protein 13 [Hemitrygon akajei]|uniref:small integral membrane protein 13 n=1 Tax=Hypanus sabinus TaxID=79690 RepID=UPI0028C3B87D|nr:small integral membrane protein 13 [Hypanus sabinus]